VPGPPAARPAPVPAKRPLQAVPAARPRRHLAAGRLIVVIIVLGLLAAVGCPIAGSLATRIPLGGEVVVVLDHGRFAGMVTTADLRQAELRHGLLAGAPR